MSDLTFADVRAAADRIAALVPPTPILRSDGIDRWAGTRVHLKAEHLHATGAFKLRGATNAVLQLSEEDAARGVVAHSSGNHASALARAAAARIAAHVPPTPVLRSAAVDAWVGTRVHLKAEHLHATGAFKLRLSLIHI